MLRGTAKMDGPAVLNNQHPPRPSLFSRLRCCARGQTAKGPADCSSAARVRLTLVHDHRLRDEGTSYHYATPAAFADAAPDRSKLRLEPLAKADQGWSAALPGRPASRFVRQPKRLRQPGSKGILGSYRAIQLRAVSYPRGSRSRPCDQGHWGSTGLISKRPKPTARAMRRGHAKRCRRFAAGPALSSQSRTTYVAR
jgi:hypothetical protein